MINYSIDDLLGDSKNRYFGSGYKKIFHKIISIETTDKVNWKANFRITKYSNWSVKNKISQNQHLSSIDSLVITKKLFDNILSNLDINSDNYVLTDFYIRSGTKPIENINCVTAKFKIERIEGKYIFDGIIGNIKVKSKFEKFDKETKNTFFKYKDITNIINNIKFNHNSLICKYFAESEKEVSIYLVTWLTVFAQLGEVLAFNSSKISRDESQNFWVRSLNLRLDKNELLKSNYYDELKLEIVKNKKIKRNNEFWYMFDMTGYDQMGLVSVNAKTALKGGSFQNE